MQAGRLASASCFAAISVGSTYGHSWPRKICPENFTARSSLTANADRNEPWSVDRSPTPKETVVPGLSRGDFVIRCTTPFAVSGPYKADPGPRTTSIRSMSESFKGRKCRKFTRSAGSPANR